MFLINGTLTVRWNENGTKQARLRTLTFPYRDGPDPVNRLYGPENGLYGHSYNGTHLGRFRH